jgi:hypothetical protein
VITARGHGVPVWQSAYAIGPPATASAEASAIAIVVRGRSFMAFRSDPADG